MDNFLSPARAVMPILVSCLLVLAALDGPAARAQDLPDLGDEIERITHIIDEARSVIARAGECEADAELAIDAAMLASDAADSTEESKKGATRANMSAETAAIGAARQRMRAVAAADRAKTAADAAAAARAAAEMASLTAEAEVEAGVPPDDLDTVDLERANEALDQAREAAIQARDAAVRAEMAAREAGIKARAAAAAAAIARREGLEAAAAVQNAARDAEAAVAAAERAAISAKRAAQEAEDARQFLTGARYASVVSNMDAARDAAIDAGDAAASAEQAAREAGNFAQAAEVAGKDAGGYAVKATDSEDQARKAAAAASDHASDARSCAEEVSQRESALAGARAASVYLSRTVVGRVQKLRTADGTSFSDLSPGADRATGMNAGDHVEPDYPPNLAVDIGYSWSRDEGLFDARSTYVLALTDVLLSSKRLFGYGVGAEYTRESLFGATERRTRGLTATVYLAEILTDRITLVPQAALTYLDRESTSPSISTEGTALRALCSVTVIGQRQWGDMELSGFGQLAYTHEDPRGPSGDDAIYVGQAIAGGEFAYPMAADARLFMGASLGYDLVRSESQSDRLSYGGEFGFRSPVGAMAELSLKVSTIRQDQEQTLGGNVFVKVFF